MLRLKLLQRARGEKRTVSFRCSVRALLYVRRATRRWQTKTTPNLPIGKGRYRSQNLLLNKVVPCDCGQSSPGRRTGFFENLISNDLSIIIEHFFLTLLPMLVSCSPVNLEIVPAPEPIINYHLANWIARKSAAGEKKQGSILRLEKSSSIK